MIAMRVVDVRVAYRQLHDRAIEAAPSHADYVRTLWAIWDGVLEKFDPLTVVGVGGDYLTRTIRQSDLTADALIEWMDAYPDGIVDRLPGGLMVAP